MLTSTPTRVQAPPTQRSRMRQQSCRQSAAAGSIQGMQLLMKMGQGNLHADVPSRCCTDNAQNMLLHTTQRLLSAPSEWRHKQLDEQDHTCCNWASNLATLSWNAPAPCVWSPASSWLCS
jgi:hypothetical protein